MAPRASPVYSATFSSIPIEIYPTIPSLPPHDRFFIGFTVDHPESVKAELIEQFGGSEIEIPIQVTKSGIANLRDPNGILIRLLPASPIDQALK